MSRVSEHERAIRLKTLEKSDLADHVLISGNSFDKSTGGSLVHERSIERKSIALENIEIVKSINDEKHVNINDVVS
jgi:hypothetical protein